MATAFTYATGLDHRWQRGMVRAIEGLTGARQMARIYDQALTLHQAGMDVWESAWRCLNLELKLGGGLENVPRQGPVVIVANHPFGIIDGITICYLLSQVRPDFKIMINSVLCNMPETRDYMLPIDFRESKDAVRNNIKSKRDAMAHLADGGAVIVFPSGGVATSRKLFGPAEDLDWKTFTARLVQQAQAPVVPIYFHGQNSRLFQIVSQFSMTLRLALLVKEFTRMLGQPLSVTLGQMIPYETMANLTCRRELTEFLWQKTHVMASPSSPAT